MTTSNTHVREALAAALLLAGMGFLASVSADVDGEGTSLDEGLATTCLVALVWPFVGVDAEVSLQV